MEFQIPEKKRGAKAPQNSKMVGKTGFEPATPRPPV